MAGTGSVKVTPRVRIGLAIYLGYVIVVFTVQRIFGVPYDELGESAYNLFFGVGLSLIVATALLAITTTALGWWRPALFERRRSVRWPIIAPILMALGVIANLAGTDWSAYTPSFFGASIVLLLVGFTEELTTRGLLVTGLRSRFREGWVWFLSTAAFALMHLINALSGQGLTETLQQVGFTFMAGTILYVLRRVTGSLLWAMVLHGMWDFSVFATQQGTPGPIASLGILLHLLAGLVAFAALFFVIRGANERTNTALPA